MIRQSILILIVLVAYACTPVRVVSTEQVAENFSEYKTFDFYQITNGEGPYTADLKNAIVRELEKKGYTRDQQSPDLRINIGTTVEDKVQTRETDYRDIAYMGQRNYSWQSEEVVVNEYKEGTVVIDFVDSGEDKLVWQGVAAGTISGNESEMIKRIDKAMEMLFDKFPGK